MTLILAIGFVSAEENSTDTLAIDESDNPVSSEISIEGDSFNDIQDAIDTAESGDTIYLNSKTYMGNGTQITVSKSITIDGASKDSDTPSVIDANDSSRIFYVNGKYDVVLKNIIFQKAKLNSNGIAIHQANGNLNISHCEFRNINNVMTTGITGGIIARGANTISYLDNIRIYDISMKSSKSINGFFMSIGDKSKVKMDYMELFDVNINSLLKSNNICKGGLLNAEKSTDVTVSNLNTYNYTFTVSNNIFGGIFCINTNSKLNLTNATSQDSNFNTTDFDIAGVFIHTYPNCQIMIDNFTFRNNNLSASRNIIGGVITCTENCNLSANDLTFEGNKFNLSDVMNGGFIRMEKNSSTNISNVAFNYNEFHSNYRLLGGFYYEYGIENKANFKNLNFANNSFSSSDRILGSLFYIHETTINSCNISNTVINTDSDVVGGFIYVCPNYQIMIDNFAFRNNNISTSRHIFGGLILCTENCNLSANDLTFEDNNFNIGNITNGGFIRVNSNVTVNISNMALNNNEFNTNYRLLGGFYCEYDIENKLNLKNISYDNNRFSSNDLIYGSLFYLKNNDTTIDSFNISNNVINSTRHRGLIYMSQNGTFKVTNINVMNTKLYNKLDEPEDPFNSSSNINQGFVILRGEGIIANSSFTNNYCNAGLGVALQIIPISISNPCIIESCEFKNNTAGSASKNSNRTHYKDHGGAICINGNYNGSAIIRNCLFVGNMNSQGGAITPHNNCIVEYCRFYNNTATKFYGGAISTEDGIDKNNANITIRHCYFENNAAPIGGAIQAKGDYVGIYNCTFKDNRAVQGGAVFLEGNNLTLINCTFTDNNATDNPDDAIMTGQKYLPQAQEWNVYGGAVYIHGFNSYLENNRFLYNSALKPSNNTLEDKGGAIYIYGNNSTVIKCYFDDNFAHSGNGSAIYILGVNATVDLSEFYNHDAGRGTVFIRGSDASILNSIFMNNTASRGGAGIYSIGNNSIVDNVTFENNNATIHGGAIHSHGDYIRVLNSRFISNNAHPSDEDMDNGLGGAIYTKGDFNDIAYCEFDFNTARNGSAIYNRGSNLTIEDCTFHYNQAYSYNLHISVVPVVSNYTKNNKIMINITHIGGDNIINAIYNDGSYKNIFFYNVTYEHSSTSGGKRNSGLNKINPVESAELSNNGELIYQDSREDLQIIDVIIAREYDSGLLQATEISGEIINQSSGRTGLYGNISFTLEGDLKPGTYNVYVSHPEDRLYKAIENSTRFEISPQVDLNIKKSSDRDTYFVGDTATYTITVESLGTDAHDVEVREIIPEEFEILNYTASVGEFGDNVWYIPLMGENTTQTLTITVRLTENGTFTNIVNVTSSEEDINPSDNVANKTITVKTYVDLDVEKTSDVKSVKVGETIVWTITVKNKGIINATGVKVTDKLPSGLKYISHSLDKGEYDPSTGIWDVGELGVNETLTLNITTKALKAGNITNTVSVSSNEEDKNSSDNEAESSINVKDNPTDDPDSDSDEEDDESQDNTDSSDDTSSKADKSVNQNKYATGNPVMLILFALLSLCITTRRKL